MQKSLLMIFKIYSRVVEYPFLKTYLIAICSVKLGYINLYYLV